MENDPFKNAQQLKKLTARYFNTLKTSKDEPKVNIAELKILNYFELGCMVSDMIKLCILALDHDMHNVPEKKDQSINVGLILETVLQLFPLDECEFLSYVGEIVNRE
ncbi:hypothetical protein ACHRVW_07460 [Flavobacterium collinsii]|uniref:hypothetical protein n=1 Tax=Flavobacterium collinsii TaxID=1114861 RepID=UPI0037563B28